MGRDQVIKGFVNLTKELDLRLKAEGSCVFNHRMLEDGFKERKPG